MFQVLLKDVFEATKSWVITKLFRYFQFTGTSLPCLVLALACMAPMAHRRQSWAQADRDSTDDARLEGRSPRLKRPKRPLGTARPGAAGALGKDPFAFMRSKG